MKKVIILASAIVLSASTFAQGLYFGLNAGYAGSLASQTLAENFSGTSSSLSYETVKGSLGKGINIGLTAGYMLNSNLGMELGISDLMGGSFENTSKKELVYDNKYTMKGKMIRVVPGIRLTAGDGNMKPYLRLGLVLGLGGKITIEGNETDIQNNNEVTKSTWEYTGGMSVGAASALGLNFKLSDKLSLNGEFAFIGQSWAPKKGTLTSYTVAGVDQLSQLTTSQKEIDFTDSYSVSSTNPPSSSQPSQSIKQYYPFSSWGINVGIHITLGKSE